MKLNYKIGLEYADIGEGVVRKSHIGRRMRHIPAPGLYGLFTRILDTFFSSKPLRGATNWPALAFPP